jgi:nucleotide-binding universal stress UspA family protein
MYRNILVPTDASPPSRRAIRLAVRLAREQKARVTGLWVGPPWEPNLYAYSHHVPPGYVSPQRHEAHLRHDAKRALDPLRRAAASAGVSCRCTHVEGAFPYLEIVRAARRHGCDLIVMGSHGRRGISRLLLGSQAAMVLAHSRTPVLICR